MRLIEFPSDMQFLPRAAHTCSMSTLHSQREAYGQEITALGAENPSVVALEADLGKSTMSYMFKNAHPDRYFEMGIAEQNMLSTAAGLAAGGKIPFCSTFAVFASGRAYDQIRQTISIGKLNVKICGSSAGLSDFGDGATHQSIDDVAIMSVIPNMTVLTPCDAEQTRQAVRLAAEMEGPVYIRVVRKNVRDYIQPGKKAVEGLQILREGTDVAIFALGAMTEQAMDAADLLEKEGISAKVVQVFMMKPFSYAGAEEIAKSVKAVVSIEDHNYIGGLASTLALTLRQSNVPMDYVAVEDQYGQSAYKVEELLEYYGLTAENLVQKVKNLLKR